MIRSTKIIRAAKVGYIALSAAFCALGALLMIHPGLSAELIGRVVGVALVAFGAIKLVGYFSKDLYRLAFQFDLAFGILLAALGAVILFRPGFALNALCVMLGVEIVADGLFKAQTAMDARRFGLNTWGLVLALALLAGVAGVALMLWPVQGALTLTRLLGAALLTEGALNLCVALCAVKIIPHQRPDVIEA